MNQSLDKRRVIIFLIFAFGIAWATALAIYLTGGLINSPELFPDSGFTLAIVLLAVVYMWAPGLAHIFTRLLTREKWENTGLRPIFRKVWLYWVIAWVGPALLTILGIVAFFAVFPNLYDSSLGIVQKLIDQAAAQSGKSVPLDTWTLVLIQTVQAILLAPLLNSVSTLGEEMGWRAYLQPKLMPLGGRKAMIWMGIIWGVWHWPITAMGHNYGLDYPGFPWLGMLAMLWFCFVLGTFLGWLTLRGRSVWLAVIGHAAINGIGALGFLFLKTDPNMLLGPAPAGLIGSVAFSLVALWIMLAPNALAVPEPTPDSAI